MRLFAILSIIGLFMLCACSGSGSKSGENAKDKFNSRTGISLIQSITECNFKWVQVGDTYGEYFRIRCSKEYFLTLTEQLHLSYDKLPSYPGSTHWGSSVGESNPNDPDWWKVAPKSSVIYHKEDYSNVVTRSVMAFWYDSEAGYAYMSVDFWD